MGRLLACCALMALAGCAGLRSDGVVRAAYAAAITVVDGDGDGALNRSEVASLVERAFSAERRAGPGWAALRDWLIAAYMAQDADGDGRLTSDELASGAGGPCADRDGDGAVAAKEAAVGIGQCPEGMLPAGGPGMASSERDG